MEVIAKGNYIRLSPKKARQIADIIRGKNAHEAEVMLKLMPQKSAREIKKVLSSAMANAENNFNLEKNELVISKIMIDGGPVLKRWQPRAKGAAFEIKKRTSHISVIVSGDVKSKKAETKKTEEVAEKETTEEHKIEIEKPEFLKKEQAAQKVDVKNKIFRRKTG